MKQICSLIIILFSVSTFAQTNPAYSLMLVENHHFRDWTHQELLSRIITNSDLVSKNACGDKEYQLLPTPVKINALKSSLKIQAASDQVIYTYRDGVILLQKNGVWVKTSTIDKYVLSILDLLKKIKSTPEGFELVSQLQTSLYSVTIFKDSIPRFEAVSSSGRPNSGIDEAAALQHFITLRRTGEAAAPFARFGTGGRIHFDPDRKYTSIETDHIERAIPAYITLAHEMYHAYDAVRGLLDTRFVMNDQMEMTQVTEYRASFFENTIRKRYGLKLRKFYSKNNNTQQSLLDSNGNPYRIPSPCLTL